MFLKGLFLFALLLGPAVSAAEDQCGTASLNGVFGFAGMGLVPQRTANAGVRYDPASQVGMVTYDGQGKVSVSGGVQYQGNTSPLEFSGTYAVNGNCSGTAVFKTSTGDVAIRWSFVIVHSGQEIATVALRSAQQSRPMYSLTFTQKKR